MCAFIRLPRRPRKRAPELVLDRLRRKEAIEEKEIEQWTIYISVRFTAQSPERIISEVFEKHGHSKRGFVLERFQ